MIEIIVPIMGESITEAIISQFYKNVNDFVNEGDVIAELETDKVTLELNAPSSGVLSSILVSENDVVQVGQILGKIDDIAPHQKDSPENIDDKNRILDVSTLQSEEEVTASQSLKKNDVEVERDNTKLPPSVQILVDKNELDISKIQGTGKRNQILKKDVLDYIKELSVVSEKEKPVSKTSILENLKEVIEPMSTLRKSIASRLVSVQRDCAILTTFNEINMTPLIELRTQYKEFFIEKYNVKLGFMGFFVKAVLYALQEIPAINAEICEDNIIYKKYYHIGIAVGGPRGLVVPVVRDVNQLTIADIEKKIAFLATKIKENSVSLSDLSGGTFTITNGGIYGSMMSTPILNPPQSAILGMHNIVKRPVVVNDEIVIHSMMYVALSYDHRLIDGKEAVTFLKIVKEQIEDPTRLFLGI